MKMCDRCRVPGCLLDYNGKACANARKEHCPDVVFTNADHIRSMTNAELAEIIMCPYDVDPDLCVEDGKNCIGCCVEYLNMPYKEDA